MTRFCLLLAAAWPLAAATFNKDVRPILSDKCFACHGPDARTKNIPLRLDVEAEARRVLVAGNPDASELIRRVSAPAAARRMPPAHTGQKLTEQEIATLREWIAQGARWQQHWSLIAPERPAEPRVRDASWPRNAIDHFVLARLERDGLRPSPEATRETLLRRVSLDLTGLPPTPQEIERFLGDRSGNAYEKAVDRLLESPRYGERMAARWLDAARYADSNGYQFDGERVMWRWRDWVIESFNRNQPYDRFVVEQIAGDMLPGATFEQKLATGFNRNHRGNTEDGIVPEEYAVEYVADRVETTSTVFLGLTLGCTRCHNHKYDPFTQKEFYQLFAYFNNVPENGRAMKYGNSPPLMPAPTREQQAALEALNARIGAQEAVIAAHDAALRAYRSEDGAAFAWRPEAGLDSWFSFEHVTPERAAPGKSGTGLALDGKNAVEFAGVAPYDIEDHFTFAAWIKADAASGAIVSRMSDQPRGKGTGVYLREGRIHVHLTSNYADDAIRVDSEKVIEPGRWHHVAVTYDGSVQAEGVAVYVDGSRQALRVEQNTLYRPYRNAGRKYGEPFRIGGGGGPQNRFRGTIDDVLVYKRVLRPEEIAGIAGTAPREFSDRMRFLASAGPPAVREAWRQLEQLRLEKDLLERTFPSSMIMAEGPEPKPAHMLIRGAYDKKGERVQPGVPAVLPPLPAGAPNNRLGFAMWLADPAHPLTARVAVNRFWQMYFGTGLVKTTEDFGQQGEWPSHPELLDWLATEFVRTGWNTKALQKTIVMSAAYRQSSRTTPELQQRDPENRLLARGPRFRLPAEIIRDQALLAAGLLREKLGGPSVKPYQPDGLWNDLAMQDMYYVQAKGADLYRRSLYTFWKRTIAPPMMVNFDAANREACVVRENRTNTPLQALNLMNDVTFLEAARMVAQRMLREGGAAADERLRYGFRLTTGRVPSDAEQRVLRESLNFHLDWFAGGDKAKQYLAQGDTPADTALDARELAAYASVASLLLNLDETVTKE